MSNSAMGAMESLAIGFAAHERGDKERAREHYERCLCADPENPEGLRLYGALLGEMALVEESVPWLRKALAANPDHPQVLSNLGSALTYLEQYSESRALLERCVEVGPEHAFGYWNLAVMLLQDGDWELGWRAFEYGFLCGRRGLRTIEGALWKGEYLGPDKTLFLHWEQGLGDTFNFLRYLPAAKAQSGARIVLEVQRDLCTMLRSCEGALEAADRIVAFDPNGVEHAGPFDARGSLLSLPLRLGLTSPWEAPTDPWIRYPFAEPAQWDGLRPLRVGLVWQGNPDFQDDRYRSTHFDNLRPLLSVPGVDFYSLQVGEAEAQAGGLLRQGSPALQGWRQTMARINHLDLVISTCTAVPHLAGAMGKEVWLMLGRPHYFLWPREGNKSLLYPSMRIFRQPERGDWTGLVDSVVAALGERVGGSLGGSGCGDRGGRGEREKSVCLA